MRPDQIDQMYSGAHTDSGSAARIFFGILGTLVGGVVGLIVALFTGLIPFSC